MAFLTSNINIGYERANKYLIETATPNLDRIPGKYNKLSGYVAELDPTSPKRSTLSQHRKLVLENKIKRLIQKIDNQLYPTHEKESQIIQKQYDSVQALINRLPLSYLDLRRALKEVHPGLKKRIENALWIALGAFPFFSCSEKIQQEPKVLQQTFPALFTSFEGTILEQISAELAQDRDLALLRESINGLEQIATGLREDIHEEEMKKKLQDLPKNIQDALFQDAVQLSFANDILSAKTIIFADTKRLQEVKDPLLPGSNIIEQLEQKQRMSLANLLQMKEDQQVSIFMAHFREAKTKETQLQALFERMPCSVKARLPQPPYYGYGFDPELYKTLGAHYDRHHRVTVFRVYAPHAQSIVLHLTAWKHIEHAIPMLKEENGVWQLQTNLAPPGRTYHFMIVGKNGGAPFKKLDPFAFRNHIHSSEPGKENHESVVHDVAKEFVWNDSVWMKNRVTMSPSSSSMAIYEVHVSTWKKKDNGNPLSWRELAVELSAYCKDMGYSHVELMALFEHPQPISMGYQITSFFALNSSMGSVEDFQFFVNYFHEQNIGVIADWVPAHFASDGFSLCSFDGEALFEDDHPELAYSSWGTYEFDFSKQFSKDFLASNLNYLLREFHFDGIRVDAVQSILNFSRDSFKGKAGDVNVEARDFLRHLNAYIHVNYPGMMMIAEEAMGFPNLIRPVNEKGEYFKTFGVGFDMTWHMGFMNDILNYMSISPQQRASNYSLFARTVKRVDSASDQIDNSSDIRPRGKVVLAFSHDENANGKGTIFSKMGGNSPTDKFANGRLLLAYQLLRGGGPILDFMGNEILQTQEWHGRLIQSLKDPKERKKASVQWEELDPKVDIHCHQYHRGARESRKALLHLYRNNVGLQDQTDAGFAWIDAKDSQNAVLSFHRRGNNQQFACIFNSSERDLKDYLISFPDSSYAAEIEHLREVKEVYNTDELAFGGEGRLNEQIEIIRDSVSCYPTQLKLRLPPFSALVLEEFFS